jgi:kumamolisin
LSETVWNAQEGPSYNESSGGVSTFYDIPFWQMGVNMSANNGSRNRRNCPDVAMVADNIFIVADDGTNETTGGTSAASPLWAGFAALANQQAVAAGVSNIGFLNPALYQIGTNAGYTACFDDITVGNNTNYTSPIEYLAVPGYDLCTGWGSPSGGSLIIALTQPDGFQITPGRGAVGNGPTGGPFTVSTQTFSLTNTGKAESLHWSLGTTPVWLNVSSTNGTLAADGGGASVSLSLNSAANLLPGGIYVANLWFTNVSSGLAQVRQFTLQVGQELVLDGGFEAADLCYWTLTGDSNVYYENFADYTGDYQNGTGYSAYAGIYFAALGQSNDIADLSQPLPTQAGQLYLLSFWFENPSGDTPNQFLVQWNTNSASQNVIFNQTNMGAFGYSNAQFLVYASTNVTTLQFGARNDYDWFVLDNVSVMPVPQPDFQASAAVNGSLQIAWTAYPGLEYQLQSTTDLAQANWTNFGGVITATTNPMPDSVTIGPDPQRFYRVVLLPQ